MSNTKHTPGKLYQLKNGTFGVVMAEGSDFSVLTVNTSFRPKETVKANLERIVRCWNSHDDLVAALQTCLFQLQKYAELADWDINDDDAYEAGKLALDTATK